MTRPPIVGNLASGAKEDKVGGYNTTTPTAITKKDLALVVQRVRFGIISLQMIGEYDKSSCAVFLA